MAHVSKGVMINFLNIIELFNLLIFFNNEKCFQKIISQNLVKCGIFGQRIPFHSANNYLHNDI